jgi:hypothetical protein
MLKKMIIACSLSILLVILLTGCGENKSSTPLNSSSPSAIQPAVSNQTCAWVSDGKIRDNEYTSCQTFGDLKVFTRVAGDSVMFGLTANTEGYLALGIDPGGKMRDADMIMCAVKDGSAVVGDMCGSGKHSKHPADLDLGGKMDLTDAGGGREGSTSVIEFKRKLDTGDSMDKALIIGENKVIWALGKTGDFDGAHSKAGTGVLILKTS